MRCISGLEAQQLALFCPLEDRIVQGNYTIVGRKHRPKTLATLEVRIRFDLDQHHFRAQVHDLSGLDLPQDHVDGFGFEFHPKLLLIVEGSIETGDIR